MIDWAKVVDIAPSIVIALLFAWFVLELLKLQRASSAAIMKDWGDRLTEMTQSWQKTIKDIDDRWRETTLTIRDNSNASTARLAEEIKRMAEQQSSLTTLMISHDERAQQIKDIVSTLEKKRE